MVERTVAGHVRSLLLHGKWQGISAECRGMGQRRAPSSLSLYLCLSLLSISLSLSLSLSLCISLSLSLSLSLTPVFYASCA